METSKYLRKFDQVAKSAAEQYTLNGDFLIVEEIADEQFQKTVKRDDGSTVSLILEGSKKQTVGLDADRPCFARVLMVGAGYYDDETKEGVPLDVSVGDIILVGRHSLKRFSVFGRLMSYGETQLALAKAEEIQMRFHGQAGFDNFFDLLNKPVEQEVAGQDA